MFDKKAFLGFSYLVLIWCFIFLGDALCQIAEPEWIPVCWVTPDEIKQGCRVEVEIQTDFVVVISKTCFAIFIDKSGTYMLVSPGSTVLVLRSQTVSVSYSKKCVEAEPNDVEPSEKIAPDKNKI